MDFSFEERVLKIDVQGDKYLSYVYGSSYKFPGLMDFFRFVVKQNGVLFENDVIQIGVKLESRANLARLGMFYGNKTQSTFHSFLPVVSCSGPLSAQLILQVDSGVWIGQLELE